MCDNISRTQVKSNAQWMVADQFEPLLFGSVELLLDLELDYLEHQGLGDKCGLRLVPQPCQSGFQSLHVRQHSG